MCIVIDCNALSPVFNSSDSKHSMFSPVKDWIIDGNGKIIYGGTKYKQELSKLKSILRLLTLLKDRDKRKIIVLDSGQVDFEHMRLENKIKSKNFNDAHIVAIVIVSGARLISTLDSKSHEFIKMNSIYPKRFHRPKIYSNSNHQHLLCDRNIPKKYK